MPTDVFSGPTRRPRNAREKVAGEFRLLRRDGLFGYIHLRYLLRRFHESLKPLRDR
jgi:hypothetical protein